MQVTHDHHDHHHHHHDHHHRGTRGFKIIHDLGNLDKHIHSPIEIIFMADFWWTCNYMLLQLANAKHCGASLRKCHPLQYTPCMHSSCQLSSLNVKR